MSCTIWSRGFVPRCVVPLICWCVPAPPTDNSCRLTLVHLGMLSRQRRSSTPSINFPTDLVIRTTRKQGAGKRGAKGSSASSHVYLCFGPWMGLYNLLPPPDVKPFFRVESESWSGFEVPRSLTSLSITFWLRGKFCRGRTGVISIKSR